MASICGLTEAEALNGTWGEGARDGGRETGDRVFHTSLFLLCHGSHALQPARPRGGSRAQQDEARWMLLFVYRKPPSQLPLDHTSTFPSPISCHHVCLQPARPRGGSMTQQRGCCLCAASRPLRCSRRALPTCSSSPLTWCTSRHDTGRQRMGRVRCLERSMRMGCLRCPARLSALFPVGLSVSKGGGCSSRYCCRLPEG